MKYMLCVFFLLIGFSAPAKHHAAENSDVRLNSSEPPLQVKSRHATDEKSGFVSLSLRVSYDSVLSASEETDLVSESEISYNSPPLMQIFYATVGYGRRIVFRGKYAGLFEIGVGSNSEFWRLQFPLKYSYEFKRNSSFSFGAGALLQPAAVFPRKIAYYTSAKAEDIKEDLLPEGYYTSVTEGNIKEVVIKNPLKFSLTYGGFIFGIVKISDFLDGFFSFAVAEVFVLSPDSRKFYPDVMIETGVRYKI